MTTALDAAMAEEKALERVVSVLKEYRGARLSDWGLASLILDAVHSDGTWQR